jgi:type II secretory ATPase GspE/PulE/Tfp pilus assembly ATPase PilB-like protein
MKNGVNFIELFQNAGYSKLQGSIASFAYNRPYGLNIISGISVSGKEETLGIIEEGLGGIAKRLVNQQINTLKAHEFDEYLADFEGKTLILSEIKTPQEAVFAVNAALSGYQVWTTMISGSSFMVFIRLLSLLNTHETSLGYKGNMDLLTTDGVVTSIFNQRKVPGLSDEGKEPILNHIDSQDKGFLRRLQKVATLDTDTVYIRKEGVVPSIEDMELLTEGVALDPVTLKSIRSGGIDEARKSWLEHQSGKSLLQSGLFKMSRGLISPHDLECYIGQLTLDEVLKDGVINSEELAS